MLRPLLGVACAAFFSTIVSPSSAHAHVEISIPAENAIVLGQRFQLEIGGCPLTFGNPKLTISVDGQDRSATQAWTHGTYPGQWLTPLTLSSGTHSVTVTGHCVITRSQKVRHFEVRDSGVADVATRLADQFIADHPARQLAWGWAESVALYGIAKLAASSPLSESSTNKYWDYLHAYHEHWAQRGIPSIQKSDDCPSALSAVSLYRERGDSIGMISAEKVAKYLRTEPRNALGALNHLGHSLINHIFPDSIWLDSLMMYGVLAVQYGTTTRDDALLRFGASQPAIFASVLQDSNSGLLRHAWKTKTSAPIPKSETYWLRGNGWVAVSIVEMLSELPADSTERAGLLQILERLASGLKARQLPNGLWDTVINAPGYAYAETSGSSLVSYALAKAVHHRWLSPEYLPIAQHAFQSVTALLRESEHGLSMPGISGPTNPGPRLNYKLIPRVLNAPYGVGAYLMAASELKDERF
jgi:unsaturated rhamnogalacturonyl hydrolase